MDPLLYDLIIKLACLFCGLVSIALGALLLFRGVRSRSTTDIKIGPALVKGAAPGTIFALVGAAIIYFTLTSGFSVPQLIAGVPESILGDTGGMWDYAMGEPEPEAELEALSIEPEPSTYSVHYGINHGDTAAD